MANNYKYTVVDISEGKEIGFKAVIPKFSKLHVVADSPDELHKAVLAAIEGEIAFLKKKKKIIPKPDTSKCSGKFILRIRPEIHAELVTLASSEGATLNQYINKILEERIC